MTASSPFKFLDAYEKADKQTFFGREEETEKLYQKVLDSNLTILYGASGTGKTSLVNCGLGNCFTANDWFDIFIRRGDNFIESFWTELVKKAEDVKMPERELMMEEREIRKAVKSLYLDYYVPIYFIFDQFEELFILGDSEEQNLFFKLLKILVESNLPVKVLIVLRDEYLADLSEHEDLLPYLFDNRFRLNKMQAKNLEKVILQLTQHHNIIIENESETVKKIITKLEDKKNDVELTYLQVYLDRLFRRVREKKPEGQVVFSTALVDEVGDLGDVMASFLSEQIQDVDRMFYARKNSPIKDIPILILNAFVSQQATKQALDLPAIMAKLQLPPDITTKDVEFCLSEFNQRRIIRLTK